MSLTHGQTVESGTKHTPTPWLAGMDGDGHFAISNAEGFVIASIDAWSAPVDKADAEFIVRACNSHEALLDMVRLFERCIEYDIRVAKRAGDDEGANLKSMTLYRVREAIKAASEPSVTTEANAP